MKHFHKLTSNEVQKMQAFVLQSNYHSTMGHFVRVAQKNFLQFKRKFLHLFKIQNQQLEFKAENNYFREKIPYKEIFLTSPASSKWKANLISLISPMVNAYKPI